MVQKILQSILGDGSGPFDSYYQSVLESAGEGVAPSVHEARIDYIRQMRNTLEY